MKNYPQSDEEWDCVSSFTTALGVVLGLLMGWFIVAILHLPFSSIGFIALLWLVDAGFRLWNFYRLSDGKGNRCTCHSFGLDWGDDATTRGWFHRIGCPMRFPGKYGKGNQ